MDPAIWPILDRAAEKHPDRISVVDGDRILTREDVRRAAMGLAAFLRARGLEPGDRVAILDVNSADYLVAYFGAAYAGLTLCPVNHRLAPREVSFILRDSGARWILHAPEFGALVRTARADAHEVEGATRLGTTGDADPGPPAETRPDDTAHLYYTSGTTGRPKGVMLTHRNVVVHARNANTELSISSADVWGHIAPMFHLADAWATFAVTLAGGRHVMVPHFDPRAVLDEIEREKITISNLIPTMLNLIVKEPAAGTYDLGSLRVILSGGAPIAPELVRAVMETLSCDYVQTYGMTETSPYLTLSLLPEHLRALPPEERLAFLAKTGRPFLGVDLRVTDDEGREIEADDRAVGEIRVKGETVTPGYWGRPEETRDAFADGWLLTGDLATRDAEGFVNIVDRRKDMIICGGENVYSVEVENVLYEHPGVLEAAVIGIPDETWGEAVLAAVVLRPGHEDRAEGLIAFCRDRLAGFKTPKRVELLGELPKTGSGKVAKRVLRERYGESPAP